MKKIEASDVLRLAQYLGLVIAGYLFSHGMADLLRHDFNPPTWFDVTAMNLKMAGIYLVIAGIKWTSSLSESPAQ